MPDKPTPRSAEERAKIALADSLFAWASLEDKLVGLLGAIIGKRPDQGMPSAIYFAPSNIETRLAIVDRAAREFYLEHKAGEAFLREWGAALNKINRLKATRNKLAHGSLTARIIGPEDNKKRVVRVAPQLYDIQRRRETAPGQLPGMGAADIEGHVLAVRSLLPIVEKLRDLTFASGGKPEPLLEILAQLEADRTKASRK